MTTHSQRTIAATAFALTAGLLLAGCSSDSSPSHGANTTAHATSSPAGSAPTASGSTAGPVGAASSAAGMSSAGTSAARGTACTLVTEQDATAALGKDPGRGSAFASHGSTQCQYGSYQTRFLLVNLTPSRGKAGYELVRGHQQPGQHVSVVDIAGVGDRAFEVSGPNTAGIYANKGDALVVVSITIRSATSSPTGPVLALAKLAASRL